MNKFAKRASGLGCLLSVAGPIAALVIYPKALWLFTFALIGVAVLVLNHVLRKDPSSRDVADQAQALLDGTSGTWDVDDYEHLNPREPQLRELWRRTLSVGGLPEDWPQLDDQKTNELRYLIRAIRELGSSRG